ncbi:Outward-rectifying potassium channel [Rhynchospora pubera]|uniref:Outward-rectifying potassium channel n=1 Tax=Rhynchospora pubera TaxID=906938 RepID=A0AAV8AU81_9POAL|nr:Outward-rectifying potassium channel [Rhynchospora pubera]KAJ4760115.1 Outward-rectifying potassium channel [Rhynchospora pubera]KAJ4800935.1 Outward-rectifying potassium channel [Rhynchospora pubera]KAJ4812581.1 Outward-rectifying potassium channel [Rhynchospora pubera]
MADLNGVQRELTDSLLDPANRIDKKKGTSQSKSSRFRRCRSVGTSYEPPSKPPEPAGWVPGKYLFTPINPSFRLVAFLFLLYLLSASTCFYFVENQMAGKRTNPILDAVYFTIVTMTTVGYGDLVPNSNVSKLLACAFVFVGMAVVALFLSKAADRLVEKQEVILFKALNMRMKGHDAEMLKAIETNKVRYKFYSTVVVLVLLMTTGTVFLWKVEKLNLVDSFYCVCATITTLGYGDESFSSEWGRVFAIFWIVISTLFVAQFFFYLAEWNTEHKQKKLAKWVLTRRTTNLDLEAADFDGDRVVGAPEFIIYKLKEMGKITQEDIAVFLEEFENLDVDQSGTLSPYDLTVAQSNQQ